MFVEVIYAGIDARTGRLFFALRQTCVSVGVDFGRGSVPISVGVEVVSSVAVPVLGSDLRGYGLAHGPRIRVFDDLRRVMSVMDPSYSTEDD